MIDLFRNEEWFAEATQAIVLVEPTATEVSKVVRGYALLGRPSPLHATLEDGSEWVIENGAAKKLSDVEITERKARMALYHFDFGDNEFGD